MNDERIVEVIANARWKIDYGQRSRDEVGNGEEWDRYTVPEAREVLAALRAEGFDLYRPEDCEKVHKFPTGFAYHEPSVPLGTYRLVPIGGEG